MAERIHLKHYRTSGSSTPIVPDNLEIGEIAVRYASDNEALYIKNSSGDVVDIAGSSYSKHNVWDLELPPEVFQLDNDEINVVEENLIWSGHTFNELIEATEDIENNFKVKAESKIVVAVIGDEPIEVTMKVNLYPCDLNIDMSAIGGSKTVMLGGIVPMNGMWVSVAIYAAEDSQDTPNAIKYNLYFQGCNIFNSGDKLKESFTVDNVTVGNLNSGDVISAGTEVWDLLKQMLTKVLDVVAVLPKIAMTKTATTTTFEVGTQVSPGFGYATSGGSFTREDGYSVGAGCTWSNIKYYKGSTLIGSDVSGYYFTISSGSNAFHVTGDYSDSTVIPKKSDGTDSDVRISAATNVSSSNVTFTGQYKYFILNYNKSNGDAPSVSDLTSDIVRGNGQYSSNQIHSDYLALNGATTYSATSTSNGDSIIIACPSTYVLSNIYDDFGPSIIGRFTETGQATFAIGGTSTTTYNVYIYPITSNTPINFKNVTFTKA